MSESEVGSSDDSRDSEEFKEDLPYDFEYLQHQLKENKAAVTLETTQ